MITRFKFKNIIKSNFVEYFYYFLLISIIITSILGGTLYLYFSSVLRNETIQSNNNILEQLRNAQEVILHEVENSSNSIVLDNFIMNFEEYYKDGDIITTKNILKRLQDITAMNNYIDSAYIIFLKSGNVLSSDLGYVPLKDFYDKDFLTQLNKEKISGSLIQSRIAPKNIDLKTENVFTIIKLYPVVSNYTPNAYIIVNLKTDFLQNAINHINIKQGSSVLVLNEQGDVILLNNSLKAPEIDNIKTHIDKLKLPSAGGYQIDTVNGKKTLISYIISDKYKLKFIYMIPLSVVLDKIEVVTEITGIICILMLLISMLLSFLMSRRIYFPIRSLMNLFTGDTSLKGKTGEMESGKEISLIANNVSNLINNNKSLVERNKDLEEIANDYKIYQRNKFLQSIMDGGRSLDDTIIQRLNYYEISLDIEGYYIVFTVSMDNYYEFLTAYSEKQQNWFFIYMIENVSKAILNEYNGFLVDFKANELVIVINLPCSQDEKDLNNIVNKLASQIQNLTYVNSHNTFTTGVSLTRKSINQIHQCYSESILAVNYRLLLGQNKVIFYSELVDKSENKILYPFAIENNILSSIKAGNRERISAYLEEFIHYIYSNPTDNIQYVHHFFSQLLSSSLKCFYEIDRSIYFLAITDEDVYTQLVKKETLQDMAQYISQIYDAFLGALDNHRSPKNKELISLIVKHIENNLDIDLFAEKLAEQFYISPSQIRKIFKDEMGITIKEFIDNARMNRAKELLQNTDIRIADIATKVGYVSIHTFARAFKTALGKTPGQYRSEHILELNRQNSNLKE